MDSLNESSVTEEAESSQEEDTRQTNVEMQKRDESPGNHSTSAETEPMSPSEEDHATTIFEDSEQQTEEPKTIERYKQKKVRAKDVPMSYEEMSAAFPPEIMVELGLDMNIQIKKRHHENQEKMKSAAAAGTELLRSAKKRKKRGRPSLKSPLAIPIPVVKKSKNGPRPPPRLNLRANLHNPLPRAPRSEELYLYLENVDAHPEEVYDQTTPLEQPPADPPRCEGSFHLPDPVVDANFLFEGKKANLKNNSFMEKFDSTMLDMNIVLIKGLIDLTNFDLQKFSTKAVCKTVERITEHGKEGLTIDKRDQFFEEPEHNDGWVYLSVPGKIKLEEAAKLQEVELKLLEQGIPIVKQKKDRLEFGTNLDMTIDGWKAQWKELTKLPRLLQIKSAKSDMLFYGPSIEGVNELQGYIKTAGVRTPCHQENSRLASVNINCGPGACVWIAIATEYWGQIHRMCEKRGIKFVGGSYWPPIADLEEAEIPYYKFTQNAGEVVWVSPGTLHYVQATGPCNNVAWNVGPMRLKQLEEIVAQTEWNKQILFDSLVPLETICFNMAENYWFSDLDYFLKVREIMVKSYCYQLLVVKFLRSRLGENFQTNLTVSKSKVAGVFCKKCKIEICNIVLVLKTFEHFCVVCADKIGLGQFSVSILRPLAELRAIIYNSSSIVQKKEYEYGAQNEYKWLGRPV